MRVGEVAEIWTAAAGAPPKRSESVQLAEVWFPRKGCWVAEGPLGSEAVLPGLQARILVGRWGAALEDLEGVNGFRALAVKGVAARGEAEALAQQLREDGNA